jgi:hypothetical protein
VSLVDFKVPTVGWSTTQLPAGYDQNAYGEQAGEGVKARLIVLVSAVRTLLRGESISVQGRVYLNPNLPDCCSAPLIILNMLLILYELLLG